MNRLHLLSPSRFPFGLALAIVFLGTLITQPLFAAPLDGTMANHGATRFTIDFYRLKCVEETDWDQGTNSDEPYAVFFWGNTRTLQSNVEATAVFGDVDSGETRTRLGSPRLWGPNDAAAGITNASEMIVLGAVMENDASSAAQIVTMLRPILAANLLIYVRNGLDRATIVSNLRRDMNNALDTAAQATGITNPDDRLGGALEFTFSHANLDTAAGGTAVDRSVRFRDNGEDATYDVIIRLSRG